MDLSSDPNDPFSFEALEATFARERAEKEAVGHNDVQATSAVGVRSGSWEGFAQQQQPRFGTIPTRSTSQTFEPDDIQEFQDDGMDTRMDGEGWDRSLNEAYEQRYDSFQGRQEFFTRPLSSKSFVPGRPLPTRAAFEPARAYHRSPLPFSPHPVRPNFEPHHNVPPSQPHAASQPAARTQMQDGRVYAPIQGGRGAQQAVEAEIDEYEQAFGDGGGLQDVNEEFILSQQRVEATRRLEHPPQVIRPQAQPRAEKLVPVSALPDRYRSFFKFGVFNAVQSKCFETAMHRNDNMVVSSPTGSGKTVIFELAIIRLLEAGDFGKAVYLAPTKALCSERARDWNAKFAGIGIKCTELTSDTTWGVQGFKAIYDSRLIITTPEKWDSITRWKSSAKESKLLESVALFLIDEVHLLREKRGSVLEVVVARMKAIDAGVRFIALSATVPNVEDVGRWLRSVDPDEGKWMEEEVDVESISSAKVFTFGDEFRPCKLTRKIIPFPKKDGTNPFMFVKTLEKKVFDLLTQHGEGKPVLIFCPTRKIVESCAEQLFKDLEQASEHRAKMPWRTHKMLLGSFVDKKLQKLAAKGIAFHHAGMSIEDRRLVETCFVQGSIMVVVSTSTLAVGVNLPAHTVVVLGTQQYASGIGMTDYSDIDVLQMIGRAGRPQFDTTALALILTAQGQERKFDAVAGGTTTLESTLQENLVEHLNSETALGTITDIPSAISWLHNSFFYIRLLRNPAHYIKSLGPKFKVKDGPAKALEQFVREAFRSLNEVGLVQHEEGDEGVASTGLGEVMSKRYIRFGTMRRILDIPLTKVTFRDLLEVLCEAEEFEDVRLRVEEKTAYKEVGRSDRMRFAVKEVRSTKDKVLVLIQMVCGGHSLSDIKIDNSQPVMQSLSVFRHAPRIAQTILDVGLLRESGALVKHGLELLRSMNSKVFEGFGSVIFRILDKIGEKALQIFAQNRITTFAELASDPRRIERLLNRNPPFGTQIVEQIKALPKFKLEVVEHDTRTYSGVAPVEVDLEVTVSATVGKQHKKKGQHLTISCLIVTSDMVLVDFRRSDIKHFKDPQSYEVTASLAKPSQVIHVLISCNEIAGVGVFANYHPAAPSEEYPAPDTRPKKSGEQGQGNSDDEFDMLEDDVDLTAVNLDRVEEEVRPTAQAPTRTHSKEEEEIRLPNGRYACLHTCKNKDTCQHACCKDGLRHPRRAHRTKSGGSAEGEPAGKSAVQGQKGSATATLVGKGAGGGPKKGTRRVQSDSSDDPEDADPLSVSALRATFTEPKKDREPADEPARSVVRAMASNRPAAAPAPPKTASHFPPAKHAAALEVLTAADDDDPAADFPSTGRAIAQALSSSKSKLSKLAYRPPASTPTTEPAPPPPEPSAKHRLGRWGETGPHLERGEVEGRRHSPEEYDDLLDFALDSSPPPAPAPVREHEEPLFLPASAASLGKDDDVEVASGQDVDMREDVDDYLRDGQIDLDRLLPFDEPAASPPRKKARTTEKGKAPAPVVQKRPSPFYHRNAPVRRSASPPAAPPSRATPSSPPPPHPFARPTANYPRAPAQPTPDLAEEPEDAAADLLRYMSQFVRD